MNIGFRWIFCKSIVILIKNINKKGWITDESLNNNGNSPKIFVNNKNLSE